MIRIALALAVLASPLSADIVKEYRSLHGLYGLQSQCLGQELVVSLGDSFGIGETSCRRVLLDQRTEGWIDLVLAECQAEGEGAEDRHYQIRQNDEGGLTLRRPGLGDLLLVRCEDL